MQETQERLKNDSLLLLEFLKDKTGVYVNKKEICDAMPIVFEANANAKSHDICTYIWTCKNYINTHIEEFGKIIISNSNGDLKIPNKEELKDAIAHEEQIALRKRSRLWKKKKALALDNTMTLDGYIYETLRHKKLGETDNE